MFKKLKTAWKSTAQGLRIKLQLYLSVVVSVATRGSEAWKRTVQSTKKAIQEMTGHKIEDKQITIEIKKDQIPEKPEKKSKKIEKTRLLDQTCFIAFCFA